MASLDLELTVLQADGLQPMDSFIGIKTTSDPYIEIRFKPFGASTPNDKVQFLGKTPVVYWTLSPKWDDSPPFIVQQLPLSDCNQDAYFELTIMDFDEHSPDDFEGKVIIPVHSPGGEITSIDTVTQWYSLREETVDKGLAATGRVQCTLTTKYHPPSPPKTPIPPPSLSSPAPSISTEQLTDIDREIQEQLKLFEPIWDMEQFECMDDTKLCCFTMLCPCLAYKEAADNMGLDSEDGWLFCVATFPFGMCCCSLTALGKIAADKRGIKKLGRRGPWSQSAVRACCDPCCCYSCTVVNESRLIRIKEQGLVAELMKR